MSLVVHSRRGPVPSLLEGSARSLLLTTLGELVVPAGEPVWTASLLYVLDGLGISEQTSRQAIARAADQGWVAGERVGREVCWSVTPELTEMHEDITQRVVSLDTAPERWDGNGIFLNVAVPQEKSVVRKHLYSALGWAGFGNPVPGLWTSPHVERLDEAKAIIKELGLRETTIMSIGRLADTGLTAPEIIARAWDLDHVAARYAKLLDTYKDAEPAPGDELLFKYLSLVDEWRKFPAIDPQLPQDMLPNWIGRRAVQTFVKLRTSWEPTSRERWKEVVQLTAPTARREFSSSRRLRAASLGYHGPSSQVRSSGNRYRAHHSEPTTSRFLPHDAG